MMNPGGEEDPVYREDVTAKVVVEDTHVPASPHFFTLVKRPVHVPGLWITSIDGHRCCDYLSAALVSLVHAIGKSNY